MALRLALVSVVASLGMALPGERDLEVWTCSAQCWMNARLAEWDAWLPGDEGADAATALPIDPRPCERSCLHGLESGFEAAIDEMVATFAAEATAVDSPAASALARVLPSTDSREVGGDLDPGAACGWNHAVQGLDRAAPPVPVDAARRAPAFEPLEVGDDLYPGEAYALNRAAEGIERGSEPDSIGTAAPPPGSRLAHAVRLTREAVFAWANLLHGPAVVAVSR
jgi:hypothetical protein